jgi:hypothetical protein
MKTTTITAHRGGMPGNDGFPSPIRQLYVFFKKTNNFPFRAEEASRHCILSLYMALLLFKGLENASIIIVSISHMSALKRKAGNEIKRRRFPWGIVTNGLIMNASRFDSLLNP